MGWLKKFRKKVKKVVKKAGLGGKPKDWGKKVAIGVGVLATGGAILGAMAPFLPTIATTAGSTLIPNMLGGKGEESGDFEDLSGLYPEYDQSPAYAYENLYNPLTINGLSSSPDGKNVPGISTTSASMSIKQLWTKYQIPFSLVGVVLLTMGFSGRGK